MNVEYTIDIIWVVIGLVIIALGALIFKNYNKLADVTGVGNLTRWQYAGFITIGVGFLVMLNVHIFLLKLLTNAIIGGGL
ncbi:hypothetical protein FACS189431_0670 [Alphaproteobacteria bacterium]|nr:hypothetical protein FACS189431_0670 [Alphaproteobacteria bacterium]